MSLDVTVRINDVIFRSREPETGSDTDGFYIDDDGFEGWNDGAEIIRDFVNRAQDHGAYDLPGFLDARVVSIIGTCWASSPEKLMWFGSQLTGLLVDGSGQIVVEQPGSTQWATGRLGARTTFAVRAEDIRSAAYQLQLWCADPRKYGEARTFAGGTPSYHYGNFTSAPVHTVTGTMPGYTINGPAGKTFTVTKPVTAGHPHTIDMATGRLVVDGAVQMGVVTSGDVWGVPSGGQITHTLTGSGGVLSTTVRDVSA